MSRQALQVPGLTCNGCERVVEDELGGVYGVTDIESNHRDGTVEFFADADAAQRAVERLSELGYDAEA